MIHIGDCLEVLMAMEPESVDGIITDPPYSSGGQFRSDRTASTASKYFGNGGAGLHPDVVGDTRDALGYALWATLWMSQCLRVARPSAPCMVFTDWRQLPNVSSIFQSAGWVWRGIVVWDKGRGCRPMAGRFSHQCEYVVWGTKGAFPWDFEKPSPPGLYTHPPPTRGERVHQTQKPVALIRQLLAVVPTGGVVLDPFAGSGTTSVACIQTGHKFIGIEIDGHYADVADRRLSEARAQPALELAL